MERTRFCLEEARRMWGPEPGVGRGVQFCVGCAKRSAPPFIV